LPLQQTVLYVNAVSVSNNTGLGEHLGKGRANKAAAL